MITQEYTSQRTRSCNNYSGFQHILAILAAPIWGRELRLHKRGSVEVPLLSFLFSAPGKSLEEFQSKITFLHFEEKKKKNYAKYSKRKNKNNEKICKNRQLVNPRCLSYTPPPSPNISDRFQYNIIKLKAMHKDFTKSVV